MSPNDSY